MDRRLLGHGVGVRRAHLAHLAEHRPYGADFLEILPEDFVANDGVPSIALERARRERPLVVHATVACLPRYEVLHDALERLARLVRRVDPAWVGDHLGRPGTPHGARDEASIAWIASRVFVVEERIRRPIALENVALGPGCDALADAEVLNELVRRTGCGILLDLSNVLVTCGHGGIDPRAYLDRIDAGAVVEVHVGGTMAPARDTWRWYRHLLARTGPVSTLVEWETEVPPFEIAVAEARRAAQIAGDALAA